MDPNPTEVDEKQKYNHLSQLITEQYALSRDLYALTESQRRLVADLASHPKAIGKALEATAIEIKRSIDRLCELRDEITVLYPTEPA